MAKLPISFQKLKTTDIKDNVIVNYLVTITEKGSYWGKTAIVDRKEIVRLRDELEEILLDSTTSEILKVSEDKALKIDTAHKNDLLCKSCEYKMTNNCVTCLFELQSPLERKLFIELRRANIYFYAQYGLNRNGESVYVKDKSYDHPTDNFKEVLTIVDFYIEKQGTKLCVYTDGHTYHERTEEQAQHDRNIDRKLQELGFQVLRYTGKDVHERPDKIIGDIKNWTERGYR
jgi:hypothetical protein